MLALICWATTALAADPTTRTVTVDPASTSDSTPLVHMWENTGWCPPDMDSTPAFTAAYATQEANWQNHAWIAAVPNKGIKNVRIHSLLNMITAIGEVNHPLPGSAYNFTLLDTLLDSLVNDHGLSIGFELMGNPRTDPNSKTGVYTSWKDSSQLQGWRVMVATLIQRYIGRYGLDAVATWRFEPWNEPDHGCNEKLKWHIECDQSSWLGYWDACVAGLADGSPGRKLLWGGPGSGAGTTTSWVLPALLNHLQELEKSNGSYHCDFIQWHSKGVLPGMPSYALSDGNNKCNTLNDIDIADYIAENFPHIAASLPLGNEEADVEGGWSKVLPWRADAMDAAGITRILAMHEDTIVNNKTFLSKNVTWDYLANDNAFLNYGDAWFEQRTLIARFEMNETNTVETIKKPTINTMAMLSLLGDRRIPVRWDKTNPSNPSPQPATPYSAPFGAIAATRTQNGGGRRGSSGDVLVDDGDDVLSETSVLLWNSNGTFNCTTDCDLSVNVVIPAGLPPSAVIRVYRIDQQHGNPAGLWNNITDGDPMQHPYPSAATFAALRVESELPICGDDECPVQQSSRNGGGGESGLSTTTTSTTITVPLPQPSVALVHICYGDGSNHHGTDSNITYTTPDPPPAPAGLQLRTTTTPGELFVRWTDVATRCIRTYELLYTPKETTPPPPIDSFVRINVKDTIFSAFVHQQEAGSGEEGGDNNANAAANAAATGCYAIRVIDYYSQTSKVSKPVCVGSGVGARLQPFVNL